MAKTQAIDYLNKEVVVKIDRPLGSKHPKHGFIYIVNYGFIPHTVSGDGEELDAYVLGCFEAVQEFKGKVIALIHRTNDDDDKLIVVPKDVTEFQERYFESIIIRA